MKRLLTLACALAFCASAAAQYPTKPLRIVVPFPGGSATDTITRILAQSIAPGLGQTILVDNKPGADGAIAATEVAKAPPDGYTLLMATNSPMSAVPAMKKSPPYDPVKDFAPITDIGRYTFFLYVNSSVPAKTFQDLVAYAKANPGKLAYATGNTTGIVSFAQMNSLAGIEMLHVPYKGEPQGMTDLVGGRVQVMWATPTTGLPFVKEGKIRALVTQLGKRTPILPDVPTIHEAGLPKFTITSWAELFGPGQMSKELVTRLNKEFTTAMGKPDVQQQMEKQAFLMTPSTPEKLSEFVKEQMESYRTILRARRRATRLTERKASWHILRCSP